MEIETKNKFIDLANKIKIELDDDKIKRFSNYMNMLLRWNEKINLTAITEEYEIVLKHFIDSLSVIKYIDSGNIIDVGTGAGFPGIPIAILQKESKITLLDSLNKRIQFLNEVINKLELKNVTTVHSRAEDFGRENKEKYDIAISRAVANLSTLVEYIIPFVKVGGKCICMKGSNIDEEIKNANFAIKELGGKIINIEKFELPNSDIKRTVIIIEKVNRTPIKYPRKAGIPLKKPLIK